MTSQAAPAADLGAMTKSQLLSYAGDAGVEVTPKMTKAQIVAAIEEAG